MLLCCCGIARGQQQVSTAPSGPSGNVNNFTRAQYSVDNRNTRTGSVNSLGDDDWGLIHNRLSVQTRQDAWRVGARIDAVWFYTHPTSSELALEALRLRRGDLEPPFSVQDSAYYELRRQEAARDLSTRYRSAVYPSKYYLGYEGRNFEATVGDFNAQLGRGFVLSLRRQDELQADTTLRGARVSGTLRGRRVRLRATALGGVLNPLRVDGGSGRLLSVNRGVTPGPLGAFDWGMPRPGQVEGLEPAPTLAPDRLVGGQLEVQLDEVTVGVQTARVIRQPALSADSVRAARAIQTSSASLDVPALWRGGSLYTEAAMQQRQAAGSEPSADAGYALYAALSAQQRPWLIGVEFKHYRRFFPLLANVDAARAAEFSTLQYNAPPTTEAHWNDTEFEGHNTCVSGGRVKLDHTFTARRSAGVWLGHYRSWAESGANPDCRISAGNENVIWDLASSFEQSGRASSYRHSFVIGGRLDQTRHNFPDPRGGRTRLFYGETYLRYDVTQRLLGQVSLQLQGWHRRLLQAQGGTSGPTYEGDHSTGLRFGQWLLALGTQYDSDPRTPDFYLNGLVQYDLDSVSNVALFAGQQRGGLVCVNGVCRDYAPFEGARIDLTLQL